MPVKKNTRKKLNLKEFKEYDTADWSNYNNGLPVLKNGKENNTDIKLKPTNLSYELYNESDKKEPYDDDSSRDDSSDDENEYGIPVVIKEEIEQKTGEKVDYVKFVTNNPGLVVVCFAAGACMLYKIIQSNTGGKKRRKTRRKNKYTRSKHI